MNLQEFNSLILDKKVVVVKDKETNFTQYFYLKKATTAYFNDGNSFHLEYDGPAILRRELKNRILEDGKVAPKSATFASAQPPVLMCIEFSGISTESLERSMKYGVPIALYEKTPFGALFAPHTEAAIKQILETPEFTCEELVYPVELSVLSLSDIMNEYNSDTKEGKEEIKKYKKVDWKSGQWISYIGPKDWTVSTKYSDIVNDKFGQGFFLQSMGNSVVPYRGTVEYNEKCWIPYVEEMHGNYTHHLVEADPTGIDMFDEEVI